MKMALSRSIMKDCSCLCWSLSGGGTNQLCDTDEHVPLMQWRRFVYSSRSISIDPPLAISHPGFPPDATLLWLDLRALQRQSELLNKSLLSETHLWQSLPRAAEALSSTLWEREGEKEGVAWIRSRPRSVMWLVTYVMVLFQRPMLWFACLFSV